MSCHFWLRAETKLNEKRVALTPNAVKELVAHGIKVTVEECDQRIFNNSDYSDIPGVIMVA
jgi:saccharopine dehydrogenase (NAD+, L-lysine forming)